MSDDNKARADKIDELRGVIESSNASIARKHDEITRIQVSIRRTERWMAEDRMHLTVLMSEERHDTPLWLDRELRLRD